MFGKKRKKKVLSGYLGRVEDGFNVCAGAVLARGCPLQQQENDECFVLLSMKTRKKCVPRSLSQQ